MLASDKYGMNRGSCSNRKKGDRILALVLILPCLLAFGCKKVTNSYPSIPTSDVSSESESQTSVSLAPSESLEITIASPLSYETCQYVAKLYVAKENNLLGEGVTGDTVDLDYLDSIDLPFVLNVYGTGDTGCNTATLQQWINDGNMPDIFLTDEFDKVVSSGYALPITDYLAGNELLSVDRTYTDMISSFFYDQYQYGIPFQTAAAVLFCDMEVLNLAGVPGVSFQQSEASINRILKSIAALNDKEKVVLPFYMAQNMLPYLPCSIYSCQYLSVSSEETLSKPAYVHSLNYIRSLAKNNYCYESFTQEELDLVFNGVSPLLSRRVGIWAGTTDELPRYDNYMPNTLNLMQYPAPKEDTYSPPLLISYPLCISSQCEHPKEICDLAVFFAMDEDALLLTSRLQNREGYLPSISSPSVWKSVTGRQKYGMYLIQYMELMDQAIYIPSVSRSQDFQKDLNYITDEVQPLLEKEREDEA